MADSVTSVYQLSPIIGCAMIGMIREFLVCYISVAFNLSLAQMRFYTFWLSGQQIPSQKGSSRSSCMEIRKWIRYACRTIKSAYGRSKSVLYSECRTSIARMW